MSSASPSGKSTTRPPRGRSTTHRTIGGTASSLQQDLTYSERSSSSSRQQKQLLPNNSSNSSRMKKEFLPPTSPTSGMSSRSPSASVVSSSAGTALAHPYRSTSNSSATRNQRRSASSGTTASGVTTTATTVERADRGGRHTAIPGARSASVASRASNQKPRQRSEEVTSKMQSQQQQHASSPHPSSSTQEQLQQQQLHGDGHRNHQWWRMASSASAYHGGGGGASSATTTPRPRSVTPPTTGRSRRSSLGSRSRSPGTPQPTPRDQQQTGNVEPVTTLVCAVCLREKQLPTNRRGKTASTTSTTGIRGAVATFLLGYIYPLFDHQGNIHPDSKPMNEGNRTTKSQEERFYKLSCGHDICGRCVKRHTGGTEVACGKCKTWAHLVCAEVPHSSLAASTKDGRLMKRVVVGGGNNREAAAALAASASLSAQQQQEQTSRTSTTTTTRITKTAVMTADYRQNLAAVNNPNEFAAATQQQQQQHQNSLTTAQKHFDIAESFHQQRKDKEEEESAASQTTTTKKEKTGRGKITVTDVIDEGDDEQPMVNERTSSSSSRTAAMREERIRKNQLQREELDEMIYERRLQQEEREKRSSSHHHQYQFQQMIAIGTQQQQEEVGREGNKRVEDDQSNTSSWVSTVPSDPKKVEERHRKTQEKLERGRTGAVGAVQPHPNRPAPPRGRSADGRSSGSSRTPSPVAVAPYSSTSFDVFTQHRGEETALEKKEHGVAVQQHTTSGLLRTSVDAAVSTEDHLQEEHDDRQSATKAAEAEERRETQQYNYQQPPVTGAAADAAAKAINTTINKLEDDKQRRRERSEERQRKEKATEDGRTSSVVARATTKLMSSHHSTATKTIMASSTTAAYNSASTPGPSSSSQSPLHESSPTTRRGGPLMSPLRDDDSSGEDELERDANEEWQSGKRRPAAQEPPAAVPFNPHDDGINALHSQDQQGNETTSSTAINGVLIRSPLRSNRAARGEEVVVDLAAKQKQQDGDRREVDDVVVRVSKTSVSREQTMQKKTKDVLEADATAHTVVEHVVDTSPGMWRRATKSKAEVIAEENAKQNDKKHDQKSSGSRRVETEQKWNGVVSSTAQVVNNNHNHHASTSTSRFTTNTTTVNSNNNNSNVNRSQWIDAQLEQSVDIECVLAELQATEEALICSAKEESYRITSFFETILQERLRLVRDRAIHQVESCVGNQLHELRDIYDELVDRRHRILSEIEEVNRQAEEYNRLHGETGAGSSMLPFSRPYPQPWEVTIPRPQKPQATMISNLKELEVAFEKIVTVEEVALDSLMEPLDSTIKAGVQHGAHVQQIEDQTSAKKKTGESPQRAAAKRGSVSSSRGSGTNGHESLQSRTSVSTTEHHSHRTSSSTVAQKKEHTTTSSRSPLRRERTPWNSHDTSLVSAATEGSTTTATRAHVKEAKKKRAQPVPNEQFYEKQRSLRRFSGGDGPGGSDAPNGDDFVGPVAFFIPSDTEQEHKQRQHTSSHVRGHEVTTRTRHRRTSEGDDATTTTANSQHRASDNQQVWVNVSAATVSNASMSSQVSSQSRGRHNILDLQQKHGAAASSAASYRSSSTNRRSVSGGGGRKSEFIEDYEYYNNNTSAVNGSRSRSRGGVVDGNPFASSGGENYNESRSVSVNTTASSRATSSSRARQQHHHQPRSRSSGGHGSRQAVVDNDGVIQWGRW